MKSALVLLYKLHWKVWNGPPSEVWRVHIKHQILLVINGLCRCVSINLSNKSHWISVDCIDRFWEQILFRALQFIYVIITEFHRVKGQCRPRVHWNRRWLGNHLPGIPCLVVRWKHHAISQSISSCSQKKHYSAFQLQKEIKNYTYS